MNKKVNPNIESLTRMLEELNELDKQQKGRIENGKLEYKLNMVYNLIAHN